MLLGKIDILLGGPLQFSVQDGMATAPRMLRWGLIDEAGGPTAMVPIQGVTLAGHGIYAVPTSDEEQPGVFAVEAMPLSGADETEAAPELLCKVVV